MGALSIGTGNPARPIAFHLRAEGHEMDQRRKTLMVTGTTALMAAAMVATDRGQAITPQELERRQKAATPSRAQRKVVKRQAVGELRAASQGQLVLGHIHPRWVRERVEALLDAGQAVTDETVDAIRKGRV